VNLQCSTAGVKVPGSESSPQASQGSGIAQNRAIGDGGSARGLAGASRDGALKNYRWRRGLHLAHTAQVRMMMREGRQVSACREILKKAQRSMAYDRAALMNPGQP
jgi:hypothetical protein